MVCIVEHIFVDGQWAILEWRDPLGLRGCGFFQIVGGKIVFERGYWDMLTFLRAHKLPVPQQCRAPDSVAGLVREADAHGAQWSRNRRCSTRWRRVRISPVIRW